MFWSAEDSAYAFGQVDKRNKTVEKAPSLTEYSSEKILYTISDCSLMLPAVKHSYCTIVKAEQQRSERS